MTGHPNHDDLLGHAYDLLDAEGAARIGTHLAGCAACRDRVERIARDEQLLVERVAPPEPAPPARRSPLWQSPLTPIGIIAVCVVCSALPIEPLHRLALAPLVLGAAAVVLWLHALLARAEADWRRAGGRRLERELPADLEQRVLFVDGLRIAVSETLRGLSRRLNAVLGFSLAAGFAGVFVVAAGRMLAPEIAAEVTEDWPNLIAFALVFALLLSGSLLAVLRLRRLGRRFLETLDALTREIAGESH